MRGKEDSWFQLLLPNVSCKR